MDKYLIRRSTMEELDDQPLPIKQEYTLGIIGSSSNTKWNRETIIDTVLNPFVGNEGSMPDKVLTPTDGITSTLIECWANLHKIACVPYEANWVRMGRRAKAIRDTRILKDATHVIFFVGPRSDIYEKIAMREAKKGKHVYTVDPVTHELVEWSIS